MTGLACSCSVITDVLWLNLSRTAVLGAGVNHNISKYREHETPRRAYIISKKELPPFPWWFLIRYQFLSLEWPLAVLQSSHSDLY